MSSKVKRLVAAAAVCVFALANAAASAAATRRPVIKIRSIHNNCVRSEFKRALMLDMTASDLIVGHKYAMEGSSRIETDPFIVFFTGENWTFVAKHTSVTFKHQKAGPLYADDPFPRTRFTVSWTLYDYGANGAVSRPVKTVIAACK